MDSPTKRFKKSTAKFIRDEISATRMYANPHKLVFQIGAAVVVGMIFSVLVVAFWFGG